MATKSIIRIAGCFALMFAFAFAGCSTNEQLQKLQDSKMSPVEASKILTDIRASNDKGDIKNWMAVINDDEIGNKRRLDTLVAFVDIHMKNGDLAKLLADPTIRGWVSKARIANNFEKLPEQVSKDRKNTVLVFKPGKLSGRHALYIQLSQKLKWEEIFNVKPGQCKINTAIWYPPFEMKKMKTP